MQIRPYRQSDALYIREWLTDERVHAMWSAGKLPYGFSQKDLEALLDEEEKRYHRSMFTAVLDDGTPAGSFCMNFSAEDKSAFMCRIVVDSNKRGQGLGQQMLQLALNHAFLVLRADTVRLSVFDCNMPARHAYEKAGFKVESFQQEAFSYQGEKWGRYLLKISEAEFIAQRRGDKTDMRLYDRSDMVKAGCHDCKGCSECCRGMGDTVILDPFDIYRLTTGLGKSFEELMNGSIALHVEEGIILPHIQMKEGNGPCVFLNGEGRCSIHAYRPGLCRLFPLGRNYEEGRLQYFLLNDCPAQNKTKVKVDKWLDTPNMVQYEGFLITWHYLLKELRNRTEEAQAVNVLMLKTFYLKPYRTDTDFYSQFEERVGCFI